ncbi:MAG: hypothetical protein U0T56_06935 [Ferruginibacter sp.]
MTWKGRRVLAIKSHAIQINYKYKNQDYARTSSIPPDTLILVAK